MSKKARVHELAKEFDVASADVIKLLTDNSIKAASHMSAVDDDAAALVRAHFGDTAGDSKVSAVEADDAQDTPAQPPADATTDDSPTTETDDAEKATPASASDPKAEEEPERAAITRHGKEIHVKPPVIVKELAAVLDIKANELIHELLKKNVFATLNQAIDIPLVEGICNKRGFTLVAEKREKVAAPEESDSVAPEDVVYDDEHTEVRAPVVAFLGHVDHGKTSLLDKIRDSRVTAGEAGGITQHIGASNIEWRGHSITFIDTPGHEAFTAMRARGANTTDIVVLVVAADDGVMPQTVEAISHAKAAGVPIIVAVNKVDLPNADPLKVLTQLQEHNVASEEWGGDVGTVQVSAATGNGIDDLLERIVLEAEVMELKANPDLPVKAIVLESQLEHGMGPTVNILVKNGTIKVGDVVICGQHFGKVKALINNQGKRIKEARPSTAAKVVGLSGVPDSGSILVGCEDEKQVKKLTVERETKSREDQLQPKRHASLEDLFRQIEEDARKDLNVIVKTDVQGTGEAVLEILDKLESPKIKIKVIHSGVGSITDNDVLLAAASDAIVVGFHVRVNPGVNALAKKEGVEVLLYSIIYELAEQMKEAMVGMLEPELREEKLGTAEILQVFELTKVGKICGCSVTKGTVRAGAKARVFRGEELIYNGTIQSLKRFQDDVKEVRQGFECGIRLDNFNDFAVGDIVDVYQYKEVAATL